MTGPLATAKALNAPITAVTLFVFAFQKSAILIGKTIGVKIAPPIPWKNRKAIKKLSEFAIMQANEKTPNIATQISITNLRPYKSASLEAVIIKAAIAKT